MNSGQSVKSQRNSSVAIPSSPASIISLTSSRSSARSRTHAGCTRSQLRPSRDRCAPSPRSGGRWPRRGLGRLAKCVDLLRVEYQIVALEKLSESRYMQLHFCDADADGTVTNHGIALDG